MRQAEARKRLVLCRAGPLSTGGKIDFTSINAITAAPNTVNGSAGGLGLLPWYIHPPNMYSNGSSTDVIGNATAIPPVDLGSAAPQANANATTAGSGSTSG